jgi:hypothetical protein
MAKEFVETEIPIRCSWCQRQKVAFLGVQASPTDSLLSLILCPVCDKPALPLVREHVVANGRLEERGARLVWVPMDVVVAKSSQEGQTPSQGV